MNKSKKSSRLAHKSETVRALSGRALTTARGGLAAGGGCGDTCGPGPDHVSNSHGNQYTCTVPTSFSDW